MKPLDRLLQRWRIARAARHIPHGSRVLDVGCADGALFEQLRGRLGKGVGIDPDIERTVETEAYLLIAGRFPADLPGGAPFDVITMLAMLEHVPPQENAELARACAARLKPGGKLILTVPSPGVDRILDVLRAFRLVDGMSLEEHYGFETSCTPALFAHERFTLQRAEQFQLGLNNLFVFRR